MIPISRRGAARWALPAEPARPAVDVLIPSAGRASALAVTLAGLAAQDDPTFRVVVSDQSDDGAAAVDPAVQAMVRVLRAQGRPVEVVAHLPRRGMAEQRQFLLEQAGAPRVLFLDDDVWLEPGALARLDAALTEAACGFVGYAVQGLSYLADVRPHERTTFEPWGPDGVRPERIRRGSPGFDRWPLHNAANLAHEAAERGLSDDDRLAYRIAWVGGCVLFDRQALEAAGGFDFWPRLPVAHAGEDVAAQWRVMETAGGAGVLPSGAVHLEAPTTIVDRRVEATDVVFGRSQAGPDGSDTERGEKDERHPEPDSGAEAPGRHRLSRDQGGHPRLGARVGSR
ncbi:glycosyltransferase family A protein [Microbacterium oryzae]|uniref:glycosyltransferase family A protein n=1 Tax=Microbacterium oryzae TaxID=743009 RepID=UPI0025AF502F|nr:glycosyltransferase family A protein [Microbacterium oryzae]MDN3309397.1 glycosyltransferase family A protein [Microbacterium oryzae]